MGREDGLHVLVDDVDVPVGVGKDSQSHLTHSSGSMFEGLILKYTIQHIYSIYCNINETVYVFVQCQLKKMDYVC